MDVESCKNFVESFNLNFYRRRYIQDVRPWTSTLPNFTHFYQIIIIIMNTLKHPQEDDNDVVIS